VDGEHYPPVVEAALVELQNAGHEVVAAIMAGGGEKLPSGGTGSYGGVRVLVGDDPRRLLHETLGEHDPDVVLDLSDEPVLDYRRRHELAAVSLYNGTPYVGADFRFDPPPRPRLGRKPTIAIIGTGKRTGKTAVAGFVARTLAGEGVRPIVVAMGRGGPAEPEVLHGEELELTPNDLVAMADAGRHAASDYVEDAMLARVPTVGCRRCGGGLAGGVNVSNVARGVEIANGITGDLILLEGSGSSIPPVDADVTVLIVPASIDHEYLVGYMGSYRLLLADFLLVTMSEEPFGSSSQVSSIVSLVRRAWQPSQMGAGRSEIQVFRTVFRPTPARSVEGVSVAVATTAPEAAGDSIKRHLENVHRCEVVGISHSLSDRARLIDELDAMGRGPQMLLCEIKAAGIDGATRWALDRGLEVAYMDNVPVGAFGDDPATMVRRAAELANHRFGTG
jgi:cyclic 2,3-diphosphoglycerate synthetase